MIEPPDANPNTRPAPHRPYLAAILLAAAALALLLLLPQYFLDHTDISLHSCSLSQPALDSVHAECDALAHLPLPLPLALSAEPADVALADDAGHYIGTLASDAVHLAACAASASFTLRGKLTISDAHALRAFSSSLLQLPQLQLRVSAPLRVRLGPLHFSLFLSQPFVLRGASGLPHRVVSFNVSDAPPASARAFPGYSERSLVSIEVELDNPSTFALEPLGSLHVAVESPSGEHLSTVWSDTPLSVPRGRSRVKLHGTFDVEERDLGAASALIGAHLSGAPTSLHAMVSSISTPVYNGALGGTRLASVLPGIAAPLVSGVNIVFEPEVLAGWASPFGSHELVLDAYLLVRNPFGASVAVMRIDADVHWRGERVATMSVALAASDPEYDPMAQYQPLRLAPGEERPTEVAYPTKVTGSFETVREMVTLMQQRWEMNVSISANMTVGFGALVLPVAYTQPSVLVRQYRPPPSPPAPPRQPGVTINLDFVGAGALEVPSELAKPFADVPSELARPFSDVGLPRLRSR